MLDRLPNSPAQMVVHDEPESCPYLEGQIARLPLRVPSRRLTRAESDAHWEQGDRRHGVLLYRPACPACRACEPMRVPIRDFIPGGGHRRVLRRGDAALTLRVGEPHFTSDRLALYEKHKSQRGLRLTEESRMGEAGYRGFFTESCVETLEMSYWLDDRLVGIAITDRGLTSMSAVYTFFDPDLARYSLGTYSILKQMQLCESWKLEYLYLGFYVADNAHMRYKALYKPHELLRNGHWSRVE